MLLMPISCVGDKGVEPNSIAADEASYVALRKRIDACIKPCVDQGLIEDRGWTKDHGVNGPYKLWVLKMGDLKKI